MQKFTQVNVPVWPRPFRAAVAFYEHSRHPPPDRAQAHAAAAALLRGPPSDFDNRIYVERALRDRSTAPVAANVMNDLATLRRLVEKIEVRGSKAYFYLLPVSGPLERSTYAKVTAKAAHAAFPDDSQWI